MALEATFTADNGAVGNYFRIARAVYICAPGEANPRWEIWLNFYASEEMRNTNTNPLYQYQINVADNDPRPELYSMLKLQPMFADIPVVDRLEDSTDMSLDAAKQRKLQEILDAKVLANRSYFVYQGHRIKADADAMLQIQTTMGGVLARGALRDDWPGAWLTMDGGSVPIPDTATWYAFYAAIEATGQANYNHFHALEALVTSAASVEEVEAIHWGMDLNLQPAT